MTVWRVGMKAVLRKGAPVGWCEGFVYPEFGKVYTVRFVNPQNGNTILLLDEVVNAVENGWEPGFNARFFRPVVTRKTDISCFREMLTKTPAELREYDEVALW